MIPYAMEDLFGQLSAAVPALSPPSSRFALSSSLARQCEELKYPWLSVGTAQQQLQHQCMIITIFIKNPKHGII